MFYFYIIRLAIFLNLYFYAEKKDRVFKHLGELVQRNSANLPSRQTLLASCLLFFTTLLTNFRVKSWRLDFFFS